MTQKLRVGVIGLGMGRGHLGAYKSDPRVTVAALCDIDGTRLQAAGTEHGIAALYTDHRKMLRDANLDAVSVATPNKFHAPMTLDALAAGCHVLCEKPPAMTVRETERMAAAARKAKRNLMINFSFRFSEMSQALKQQVEAGVVGDIYFGRTVWHRRRGIPGLGGWFTDLGLAGGGPLIDLGVHRLDLALWLMDYPAPVTVTGSTYAHLGPGIARRQNKSFTVEDLACGLVRFANGASLVIEASWALNLHEPEHMVTSLYGTRGGLMQRNTSGGYQFTAELFTEENGSLFTKRLDGGGRPGGVPSAYAEFISSIVEHRAPSATIDHGLKVMRILEGIYRSAKSGREVRYTPAR